MYATPSLRASRGDMRPRFTPPSSTWPRSGRARPVTTCASSLWPLPATPATPSTSPGRTSRLTPRSAEPRAARSHTSSTRSSGSPTGAMPSLCGVAVPAPTMSRASSAASTSPLTRRPTTLPPLRTVMRSAARRTSSSLWLMRRMPRPPSRMRSITWKRASDSCGVSTLVGSSRIRSLAPWRRALRISTRCCSPGARSPTNASMRTSRP